MQSPTLRNLDAHLRRRLRAIQLKQWKRRRNIARNLVKQGAKYDSAWKQVYQGRRSLWALSHAHVVDRTLNVAWYQRKGLVSLGAEWRRLNPEPVAVAVQQNLLEPRSSGAKPLPSNGKPPHGRPKNRM